MGISERLQMLVEQRLGLNALALSMPTWRRALKERMAARRCFEPSRYLHLLLQEDEEWQALIDYVVVPETWFFREMAAFEHLQRWVQALTTVPSTQFVRLLSLPCSSGEEPYAMAMALQQAQIKTSFYHIDGVDISQAQLKRAAAGLYGRNSFRGTDLSYRDHYFTATPKGYHIRPELCAQITWRQGNALDATCFSGVAPYDVIFCRNLLIYLHTTAQKCLLSTLQKLLTPKGILVVASAELEIARAAGWELIAAPVTCTLQHVALQAKAPLVFTAREPRALTPPAVSPPLSSDEASTQSLQSAQKMADDGDFETALQLCQMHLQNHVTDSNGYYLLGVIHHARHQPRQAEESFQKAIYLAPHHHEALFYLALLMEQKGDYARGAIFRQRAQRSLAEQQAVITNRE